MCLAQSAQISTFDPWFEAPGSELSSALRNRAARDVLKARGTIILEIGAKWADKLPECRHARASGVTESLSVKKLQVAEHCPGQSFQGAWWQGATVLVVGRAEVQNKNFKFTVSSS